MPYENELLRIALAGFKGTVLKGTRYPLYFRVWKESLCELKNDVAYRIGVASLRHLTHAANRAAQVIATAFRVELCVAVLMNPRCANILRINGRTGNPTGNPFDILKYALTAKSAIFFCMPN